jgi:hypothetical protein
VVGKTGLLFVPFKKSFLNYFDPKTSRKHHKNLVILVHDLQKHNKTATKSKINSKPKIFLSSYLFFQAFSM